ncbi:hypothetical protein SUGI_1170370 [Cryptomeria japonica]|nr:hypothetical protein SUGI_1170370 [Cryptomeria japonica]
MIFQYGGNGRRREKEVKLHNTTIGNYIRFSGTINGIGDVDPVRWPASAWRSLKVQWYENSEVSIDLSDQHFNVKSEIYKCNFQVFKLEDFTIDDLGAVRRLGSENWLHLLKNQLYFADSFSGLQGTARYRKSSGNEKNITVHLNY